MPILNVNGTPPKPARLVHNGTLFGNEGVAAQQHPHIGFYGTTYSSPFTASAIPPLGMSHQNSTQEIQPATVPGNQPGVIAPLRTFSKIHPSERASSFNKRIASRPLVQRVGGPSRTADTPANPNAAKAGGTNRRKPSQVLIHKPSPTRALDRAPHANSFQTKSTATEVKGTAMTPGGSLQVVTSSTSQAGLQVNHNRWNETKVGAAG